MRTRPRVQFLWQTGISPAQTLNGGTLQAVEALSWNKALALTSLGGSLDTNGLNCIISGTISGAGALTKTGGGILTLTAANTYAGGTNFSEGTVRISSDTSLGAASGGLTFRGGSLQFGADIATMRPLLVETAGGYLDI